MINTPSPDNLIIGAGMLYFDRFDPATGKPTGNRRPLGNVPKFGLKPEIEKKEKFSSMTAAKRLLKSIITSIKYTGNVTLDEFDPMNLGVAFLGDSGILTQAAATGLTKQFASVSLGMGYSLEMKNVKSVVLKVGAATLVEGVDYKINLRTGFITLLRTATAVKDGDTLDAAFDADTFKAPQIVGGTNIKTEGLLYFVGDPTTGPAYELTAWKVMVSPDGEIDWISEDWGSISLNIEIQDDSENHPTEPFFKLVKIN